MLKSVYILAFSGHRHLPAGHHLEANIEAALRRYQHEAEALNGELHLHCMLAFGSDLIAIEAAQKLQIPVHLILPKRLVHRQPNRPAEGLAEDYYDVSTGDFLDQDWERTLQIIHYAESGLSGGSVRVLHSGSPDPECFYEASVRMLSIADGLLIVWNGLPAKGLGGSADVRAHALTLGLPIWALTPEGTRGDPAQPAGPLLNNLGADIAKPLLAQCEGTSTEIFTTLDENAEKLGASFRGKTTKTISFHFYATLLAALAASIITYPPAKLALIALSIIQGVLVTAAWIIQRTINRSNSHSRWLNLRFAAELVRSVRATHGLSDPLYPCIEPHSPTWARFTRTIGLGIRHGEPLSGSWEESRSVYVRERLDEQIAYFERKKKEADKETASLQKFLTLATNLAPWVAVSGLLYKLIEKMGWDLAALAQALGLANLPAEELMRFLPIALPLLAGYLGSRRQASDASRRRIKYIELARQLRALSLEVSRLRTKTTAVQAIKQAEELLLSEQMEWRLRESQSIKR